jgi:hypothetical protein
VLGSVTHVVGQTAPAAPREPDAITVSGSIRSRLESSNWFGDDPDGDYRFSGSLVRLAFGQSRRRTGWQLELAAPILVALPERANKPGAQGALGLGGNYFASNDDRAIAASIFAKQAFLRFEQLGGVAGQSLQIGRFEFIDGAEVVPKDGSLALLKRERIAHRLIGTFGFTHVGRSFDGARYTYERPRRSIIALASRPTEGVFQVNGWGELNIIMLYGALTTQVGSAHAGEWRVFGLDYIDRRREPVKSDNRLLERRQGDRGAVRISTIGGHYLRTVKTAPGPIDLLLWAAAQYGNWGALAHGATAFSVEGGWQPAVWSETKTWVRAGFTRGSGDNDPNDMTHRTFFQVLPTPRVYARFPFYNMMNSSDLFAELRSQPARRVVVRSDLHALRTSNSNDLWYQGGGAFQPATFGYVGRPTNGDSTLATLFDGSVDVEANPHLGIGFYGGYASGGAIPRSLYDRGSARFGFVELLVRF